MRRFKPCSILFAIGLCSLGCGATDGKTMSVGGSAGTAGASNDAGSAGASASAGAGVGGSLGAGAAAGAAGSSSAADGGSGGSVGTAGGGAGGFAGTMGGAGAAGAAGTTGTGCTAPIAKAANWADITAAHTVPTWLKKAKLGIQIHWGLYSVPAYHNEWFFQHEYCNQSFSDWTSQNFPAKSPLSGGPWGYKDFIPLFTAAKWDPNAWAELFKKAGATWVQLSAQHHDRFALWDSALTKWDAKDMGPKRDLVGDLATAVRAQGLKFGVSNHIMYGDSFAYCGPNGTTPGNVGPNTPASVSDLYDPQYADFYGPPNGECGVNAASTSCSPNKKFCDDWLARSTELAEKYQLDVEWFDWDGANQNGTPCWTNKQAFVLDYYKKACEWGKEVTTAGKGGVFPGDDNASNGANIMIHDFETGGHAPAKGQEPKSFWMVDDKIGSASWGYVTGMTYRSATSIINQLEDYSSRGGVLVLNISPMADGTIPQGQQDILNAIGKHLGAQ
jgi:alpha-L-fucosidase